MSENYYTRVSPVFDETSFDGVLLAAEELGSTYGFTELGYDEVDYDVAPIVLEVSAKDGLRWAGNEDVDAAAEKAGVQLWVGRDDYLAYWPGARIEDWAERTYRDENTEANQLLAKAGVRTALDDAGFDAYRGRVVVGNEEPEFVAFWKRDTWILQGPVELVCEDPAHPYHVRIADAPAPGF